MTAQATSYPRGKVRVLLLENISDAAVSDFSDAGYANVERLSGAVSVEKLCEAIRGVHVLGIRSKTHVSAKVLENADKLLAVGCFCIGVNQVDLSAATERGIAVFNAPYSNTRSVAELVIGLCVVLIRKIADKNAAAHRGEWLKDAKGCFELRGKTIGIVGYGNIGSQVSIMAEAMGMNVVFYDIAKKLPLGNAKKRGSLDEVLAESDIVTLHVPSDATTRNMIAEKQFGAMKSGTIFINHARGDVVNIDALKRSVDSGKIVGAAIDVFPIEPEKTGDVFVSPLQNLPNVILTPHIGGSTEEAQANIGVDVANKLVNYLEYGTSDGSHTVPPLNLPTQDETHRILHIHKNIPGVLGEINSRLSSAGINILGQYLKTNETIGYVILDVDRSISTEAAEILSDVNGTIKLRVIY